MSGGTYDLRSRGYVNYRQYDLTESSFRDTRRRWEGCESRTCPYGYMGIIYNQIHPYRWNYTNYAHFGDVNPCCMGRFQDYYKMNKIPRGCQTYCHRATPNYSYGQIIVGENTDI